MTTTTPIETRAPLQVLVDRDEYCARNGNERFARLVVRKLARSVQRGFPSARLRRQFARIMGVNVERPTAGEREAWIGQDVHLDDVFSELITIEPEAVIGLRAMILCHDDATRRVGPVRVGRGAFVGAGAIVLPGVSIGERARVGAGAVVTKDIPAEEVWAGVPARPLGRSRT